MAFQFQSGAFASHIHWITSLANDELGPTRRLTEDIEPLVRRAGLQFEHHQPGTAADFISTLADIARDASLGHRPFIHIEAHGDEADGIKIAPSGEKVSWTDTVAGLRAVNVATKNNLCVVSTACYGLHVIWGAEITDEAPFYALFAPEKKLYVGFIESNIPKFYTAVFSGMDILEAHEEFLSPDMQHIHSEKLLLKALAGYIKQHCRGKGNDIRRESLMTQVAAEGLYQNRFQKRQARSLYKTATRPSQALVDRYVNSFLLGKNVGFTINDINKIVDGWIANDESEAVIQRKLMAVQPAKFRL